jgi:glucose/arabinose dehydrogenase
MPQQRHHRGRRFGARVPPNAALLALAALLTWACSDDPTQPDPSDPVSVDTEIVISGLASPLLLTAPAGDDRLFVVQRGGRIRIVEDGVARATPFLDIGALITAGNERGLLGLAFHPDYASNGYFFVNYTDADDASSEVVRYTVSADRDIANAASALPILSVDQPYSNHNGGLIAFGPDGMV